MRMQNSALRTPGNGRPTPSGALKRQRAEPSFERNVGNKQAAGVRIAAPGSSAAASVSRLPPLRKGSFSNPSLQSAPLPSVETHATGAGTSNGTVSGTAASATVAAQVRSNSYHTRTDAESDMYTASETGTEVTSVVGGSSSTQGPTLASFVWDSGKGLALTADPDGHKALAALQTARAASRAASEARARRNRRGGRDPEVGIGSMSAEPAAAAPQISVVGGEIVVSSESLVVRAGGAGGLPDTAGLTTVIEGEVDGTTASSFAPRAKPIRWSTADTERFYNALQQTGADFTLIQTMFPDRTRRQIKAKFRTEERLHPQLVDAALMCSTHFDEASYNGAVATGLESVRQRVVVSLPRRVLHSEQGEAAVQAAVEKRIAYVTLADALTDTRPPQEDDAAALAAAAVAGGVDPKEGEDAAGGDSGTTAAGLEGGGAQAPEGGLSQEEKLAAAKARAAAAVAAAAAASDDDDDEDGVLGVLASLGESTQAADPSAAADSQATQSQPVQTQEEVAAAAAASLPRRSALPGPGRPAASMRQGPAASVGGISGMASLRSVRTASLGSSGSLAGGSTISSVRSRLRR